jgi:hypothetical protein
MFAHSLKKQAFQNMVFYLLFFSCPLRGQLKKAAPFYPCPSYGFLQSKKPSYSYGGGVATQG